MLEAPIGAAAFNNEFGRPNLCGYFRTFEMRRRAATTSRSCSRAASAACAPQHAAKKDIAAGNLLIQLGGPGLLIGMGGGAASSMGAGANVADLDFDSVQRDNAEMQRRAQEVIDRCWQLGAANPILSIHDVGAGGLSNALPELAHGAGARRAHRAARDPVRGHRHVAARDLVQRGAGALRPRHRARRRSTLFRQICERERCPFAVLGTATDDGRLVVDGLEARQAAPVDIDLSR